MWLRSVILLSVIFRSMVLCYYVDPEEKIVMRVIRKCAESKSRLSCFADKASNILERSMDFNITLFEGIELRRNSEPLVDMGSSRSLSPFERLTTSLYNFLDSHTVSLDLTREGRSTKVEDEVEEETKAGGGGGGSGGSGGGVNNLLGSLGGLGGGLGGGGAGGMKGGLRREVRYIKYAFMVLLGIFGLTAPIFMKTLAIIAAKALIASKAALIIVGSVALKKIFQKDPDKSTVQVHTIHDDHDDEHDRLYQNPIPYNYYGDYYQKPS
ncbi:hypothetical protein WA026_000693 [Henosepilachna vigintioctopunctata]|uniref:Uncharacterized protein n=1 Tax=Henosepilachna vigintioctopunctata TaxID=420089 RepID=A0AAW1V189_9CUCU